MTLVRGDIWLGVSSHSSARHNDASVLYNKLLILFTSMRAFASNKLSLLISLYTKIRLSKILYKGQKVEVIENLCVKSFMCREFNSCQKYMDST